jgi:signal transduction histidine kinase
MANYGCLHLKLQKKTTNSNFIQTLKSLLGRSFNSGNNNYYTNYVIDYIDDSGYRVSLTLAESALIDLHSNESHQAEIDYICISGDLLSRMMTELQVAAAHNVRLALAMATAGHDLRQRLQSLLGTIELMIAAKTERAADLGRSAKAKIFRLANELEELARHTDCDTTDPRPLKYAFDVEPVLQQVHKDWCSEARAKSLGFKVAHTVAMVESDPYLLAVIVNNVVANAVRYTQRGEVCVGCKIQEGHLMLEVRDTGPCIPDAILHETGTSAARSTRDGLGLGLSIVKQTADLLGHPITFLSDPDQGTLVRLKLPLIEVDSAFSSGRRKDS